MTSNKEQTAVDILFNRFLELFLFQEGIPTELQEAYNLAKEMEEEKMIEFAYNALKIADSTTNRYVDVDELYNKLYGGDKSVK
jgi:hypothetical protein